MPRVHQPGPLVAGQPLPLSEGAARHVQVLRLQPGDDLTLFNGEGGQWRARVVQMGRREVIVEPLAHEAVEREAPWQVHLWVGLTANERMDWLIEKATELGVASITPVEADRSVLRLKGERAVKRQLHWQAVAVAACEQCGRNRVPAIHEVAALDALLAQPASQALAQRVVLSLAGTPRSWAEWRQQAQAQTLVCLSGPEGGLTEREERLALDQGFVPLSLGPRVLRAETAPLAVLAALNLG